MTAQKTAPAPEPSSGRKSWVRKTAAEVVLEQINRQESRVAEMREELSHEERELEKLLAAKKVLEAQ
jgi:hypothetical protein